MENLEKIVVSLKDSRPLVKIGWTGENDARGIVWDISTWQTIYGNGTCTLLNQRETDDAPYPCSITIDGKFAVWQVADADLGTGGNGKCQLIYQIGEEVVAKSPVYRTLASKSLGDGTEPPESASDWVLQVLQAGQDAVDAAERAEDAANKVEDAADGATEAINSTVTSGIQAVNDAKNAGVQAVNDEKKTAVEAVQGAQTTALNAITEAQTQATEAVETAGNQALQDISDAKTSATGAVNTAGENAVNSVNSAGQTAVENTQTAITAAKNQAVSSVQSTGQSAVEKVQEAQTAGVQAVEAAQTNAVQAVQDAGNAEVEKINGILPVPTEADAGKVPVAKSDGTGYELGAIGGGTTIPNAELIAHIQGESLSKIQQELPADYDTFWVVGSISTIENGTSVSFGHTPIRALLNGKETNEYFGFIYNYLSTPGTLSFSLCYDRIRLDDGSSLLRLHGFCTSKTWNPGNPIDSADKKDSFWANGKENFLCLYWKQIIINVSKPSGAVDVKIWGRRLGGEDLG